VSVLYWVIKASRFYTHWTQPIAFLARSFIAESGKLLSPRTGGLCLDVGAGTSPYRAEIEKYWNTDQYISMDVAPSDSTSLVASADNVPMHSGVIDLVISFDVLQHLQNYEKALDEMARVLCPGGAIILSVPFLYSECDMHDFRRWTMEGIVYELKSRGFDVVSAKTRGGMLFALGCFGVWAMQHIIPGQRGGWRSQKNSFSIMRAAAIIVLTAIPLVLTWIALALDSLLPRSGMYMGVLVCAQKRTE
jgi:SAM-dependent methyltransferase